MARATHRRALLIRMLLTEESYATYDRSARWMQIVPGGGNADACCTWYQGHDQHAEYVRDPRSLQIWWASASGTATDAAVVVLEGMAMKLSPEKVEQLSAALVDYLAEVDGVMFQSDDSRLRLAVQQVIADELQVEERLDAEVHKMLQSY